MVATLDAAAPFNPSDLTKAGYGNGTLYLAPDGTAMPPDSVNMGTTWGGAWVAQGGTDTGITIGWSPQTVDLTFEESPIPAAIPVESSDFPITAVLAEDTLANMLTAFGCGSIATQAPGAAGAVGKSTLTMANQLNKVAVGVEYMNPMGHWSRVYVPHAVSVGSIQVNLRRAAEKRMYACTFRAICLPSQIQVVYKTAESTS